MVKFVSSRARMRALKREGYVAWSSLATRASVLVGVTAFLMCMGSELSSIAAGTPLPARAGDDWLSVYGGTLRPVVILICGSSLVAFVCGVVSIILQTGGAIGTRIMLVGRQNLKRASPVRSILSVLLVGCLSIGLMRWALPRVHDILRLQDYTRILPKFKDIGVEICKLVIVGGVVLAILSSMVNRFFFRLRHGMNPRGRSES